MLVYQRVSFDLTMVCELQENALALQNQAALGHLSRET